MGSVEFKNLHFLYKEFANNIRWVNGLAAGEFEGLSLKERQVALKLNQIFSQWIDHARVGILEVQLKKEDFVTESTPWEEWENFFRKCGFFVFYEFLEPGCNFCLSVDWNSYDNPETRNRHRVLDEEEQKWLEFVEKESENIQKFLENPQPPPVEPKLNRKQRRALMKVNSTT